MQNTNKTLLILFFVFGNFHYANRKGELNANETTKDIQDVLCTDRTDWLFFGISLVQWPIWSSYVLQYGITVVLYNLIHETKIIRINNSIHDAFPLQECVTRIFNIINSWRQLNTVVKTFICIYEDITWWKLSNFIHLLCI